MTTNLYQKWQMALLVLFLPLLSFGQSMEPYDIALRHLADNKEELGLSLADLQNHLISDLYSSKHNGVTHVYLKQTHQGIEVYNALLNVNLMPDGKILNIGNRFEANLAQRINSTTPGLSAEAGLAAAMKALELPENDAPKVLERISDKHFIFNNGGIALQPIPVKLVYMPTEDKEIRLAWNVTLYELDGKNWWNLRVDAQTGEVLHQYNQVLHCDFGTPDHTCTDHKATPSQHINQAAAKGNNLANSYNVYPMPIESPNHGPRSIVTDPADPIASPYGWHDTDGAPGAEFTVTNGNNTHTYHDIFNLNASVGDEPDGGVTLDFDFPLDLTSDAPYTYIDAAMTNLFYWTNIMHDLWYAYGFDEISGNFQVTNYLTNQGEGGDPVHAQGMDGSGTNNANFGTSEDGSSATMQMYLWTSDALPNVDFDLVVNSPAAVAGDYPMVPGGFGANLSSTPVVGILVEVIDDAAPTSDACDSITNGAALMGNIALIDRGDCEFGAKALAAENEGAIAFIMCNNVTDAPISMGAGAVGAQVTIPGVMIAIDDCATIRAELANNVEVEIGFSSAVVPQPGPSGVTGDLDNGIIAHEYGHGISIRLTGGPSTGGCLGSVEQAGEGWSDWFALVMQTTPSNTADEGRGIGTYAGGEPTTGGGIRQYPYSRNMAINPHTYGNVPSVAIPHGVGSVWAAMIWDLYWNLIDVYGFDTDFYNGTGGNNLAMQLVIDGIKLQACSPSFIDSRDAILAADAANNSGANTCLIWETFARRGLGWSATAGGNEAFDLAPTCVADLKITKTAPSQAQADGTMTYTFEVINDTPGDLTDVTISDDIPAGMTYIAGSSSCGTAVVSGSTVSINLGTLASGDTRNCTIDVMIAAAPFTSVLFADDMENGDGNWTVSTAIGTDMWTLSTNNPHSGTTSWYADNPSIQSDQYLDLVDNMSLTGTTNPFLSFWHSYNTELDFDGGVLEVSTDGGTTWVDMGNQIFQNGYDGPISENDDSAISLRDAWHGNSGGYIQTLVDLFPYIDMTVSFRFRLASDAFVGSTGWYVDDVLIIENLYEITNEACVDAAEGDNACSSTKTMITGVPTGIKEVEPTLQMAVYPNPAQDKVFVDIADAITGNVTVSIFSADGRLVRTIDKNAQTSFELNVKGLSNGLYLIKVKTTKGTGMQKVVIND